MLGNTLNYFKICVRMKLCNVGDYNSELSFLCLKSCTFVSLTQLKMFTARARSTMRGYVFSLSTDGGGPGGGFTPSPSHNTSTGPMSFLGGTPVTGPFREGYPMTGYPLARSGWGPPALPGTGYAWTGYAAGGTHLAVSHRRSVLFNIGSTAVKQR